MNTRHTTVKVPITVAIDTESWALEYGLEGASVAEIRADVKRYIQDMVNQQLDSLGLSVL